MLCEDGDPFHYPKKGGGDSILTAGEAHGDGARGGGEGRPSIVSCFTKLYMFLDAEVSESIVHLDFSGTDSEEAGRRDVKGGGGIFPRKRGGASSV